MRCVTGVMQPEWVTDDDLIEIAELTKMALAEIGYHVNINTHLGRPTFDEDAAPLEIFQRAGRMALAHVARRKGVEIGGPTKEATDG